MKVTEKKIEGCEALLTIEMDSAATEGALDHAYQRLVKKVDVPGFRKGKAPRAILENFVGRERLIDESLDEVLPHACAEAIKEEKLQSFGTPGVEVLQNEPLIFKARVPLPPKVELGDYLGIRLEPEKVEVKDEIIDGMIRQLQHEKATWELVERPVKSGDLVVMDLESTIDGAPFINQKGLQIGIDEQSKYPAPGFSQEIIGLASGQSKEFKLRYPDDFGKPELAGKEPEFKIKINEVKEEKLPPTDDDFAMSLDVEMPTFDALKTRLTENYRKRVEQQAVQDYENRLVAELIKISKVEYPANLVDMEYERLVNNQMDRWRSQVNSEAELEELLARVNPEELAKQLRPMAEERIKISLALGKLASAEDIKVTDADVDAEVARMLEPVPEEQRAAQQQQLASKEAREQIVQVLLSRKTMERLKQIASGQAQSAESNEQSPAAETQIENKEEVAQ
ncbi:trigger factor [Dehalogenimonas formicexedens]|uniref:Trigger factor n=1 Tax=Dehalogenimonas formicexedens TaxID=1839801 RepID=A0A1P8F6S6_9CHLR|nr:trigger factor [Dehalogenimonas formicexedens]APV44148.1 trigger factor [Dehalogenimonas formicexedens]